MSYHHKYSLSDLEGLMPFELDIYSQMVIEHIAAIEKARGITNEPPKPFIPPNIGLE